MAGNNFHRPAHFQQAGRLQLLDQHPSIFCLERPWRGGHARGELVNARPDGVGAHGVQRLLRGSCARQINELVQHTLKALKHTEIDVHAQRRDVAPIAVLDADRRTLDLTPIGKVIGIVGNHLINIGILNSGQPQFGGRMAGLSAGKIVMDRQHGMRRVQKVVDDHLAKGGEGPGDPFGDLLKLFEQPPLLRRFRCHGRYCPLIFDTLFIFIQIVNNRFQPGLLPAMTTSLHTIETPAALIDVQRMQRNIEHMQARMDAFGVTFRPHVKTAKCISVTQAQMAAGAHGITVSTLKEAEQFFAAGITDILYAVGISIDKLPRALALCQRGCDLKLIVDNVDTAHALDDFGKTFNATFEVWIEIDTDGHRSGIKLDDEALLTIARILQESGMTMGGVMTHAGSSYDYHTPEALRAIAEQERAGAVKAAQRLREAGFSCPVVSVGSTPTALSAEHLKGVTEVRAGVYALFDLVMHNVGVCALDDIALSVITTVIGHQEEKGWAIVDAGWMAMSRDRGTQKQTHDFGFGQVCTEDGTVLEGYILSGANQEHGILSHAGETDHDIRNRFPIGTRLRILPNHACATGAQHPHYAALAHDNSIDIWPRFYGW